MNHQVTRKAWRPAVVAAVMAVTFASASTARAQAAAPAPEYSKWSFDVGIGWDNGISGHLNSSGIGTINNQIVVMTSNTYEDVYGTGLHLRIGGGYALSEDTEVIGVFTFQSLDADEVTPAGDIGISNLYAQYTDYQSTSLDVGLRRYAALNPQIRMYGEGTIGLGFIDEIDATIVAPGANIAAETTDFYDQTTAFVLGANAGVLIGGERSAIRYYVQLGLRFTTGLSEVDDLIGTGLDEINDKSSRWTMPFVAGIRFRF